MAQADILTGKILPGPVQSGQFAVMGILRRDIVPSVVRRISRNELFPLSPHLQRQVNRVGGHPVGFMGGDEDGDVHDTPFTSH